MRSIWIRSRRCRFSECVRRVAAFSFNNCFWHSLILPPNKIARMNVTLFSWFLREGEWMNVWNKIIEIKGRSASNKSRNVHRWLRIKIEYMDCPRVFIFFPSPSFISHIDSDTYGRGGQRVRQDNGNDVFLPFSQAPKFEDERRNVFRCVELL